MKRVILSFLLCGLLVQIIQAQNTIRKNLVPLENNGTAVNELKADTAVVSHDLFMPEKIVMKNYEKKIQDARESFFIVNNTPWHISRLEVMFRYTDLEDKTIHERTAMVECDLPSNSVRHTSIKSFDTQHQFYYYLSKQPKRESRPYKVLVKILRYDIVAD